jgi:hypothetical protein
MQVVHVTDTAIKYNHPREAFFALFPREKTCETCSTKVILDTYEDVTYVNSGGYEHFMWTCPLCGHGSHFWVGEGVEQQVYLEGYKELVPNWWRDNKDWVIPLVVILAVIILFVVGFLLSL